MEDARRQAETSLSKFSHALDQLEQTLRPVLKALDELRASGNEEDLDAMSRARMHISLAYAVNTLFCMYLRTQGVDPATHPISDEIGRVQDAFMRMRKVEAGLSVDHQRPPDRDRRRYYENMRRSSQKLAGMIFPEEVDLLNALRGKKRRRESDQKGREEKFRKVVKESTIEARNESDSSDDDRDNANLAGSQRTQVTNKEGRPPKEQRKADSSSDDSRKEEVKVSDEVKVAQRKAKKKKKGKNDEKTKDDSDKEKPKDKDDKKEKKSKKSKKETNDQEPKGSARSEEKRKRKKKKR